jgi:2-polyprenyl-6-methoxyphenol hydroxylase-like FAD-dependent oxidoreductase
METEVIVVGGGPTGLMLAAELGLAGVRTVVVEKLVERSGQSKAGGLQPRTAEVLDQRGLLDNVLDRATARHGAGGHFAALPVPLDCRPWRTRHPWGVRIPQARVEEVLEKRVVEYGIPVLRGHELVTLDQDTEGVTGTVTGPDGEAVWLRGQYLLACDGAHSRVRKLVGVGFPGTAGTISAVVSEVVLTSRSDAIPTTVEHFSRHIRGKDGHWTALSPLDNGCYRLMFGSPTRVPRDTPVTLAEARTALQAVYGEETDLQEIRWASRFSNASRQVDRYRVDRVFFAGDAAHIHLPVGGQGINLGIQDAVNLGWKLAARLRDRAGDAVLDGYHVERHPVAARVLNNTKAQGVLMNVIEDENVAALRDIVLDLARTPDGNRYLAGMISGLDVRYGDSEHPLVGSRMPDLGLTTAVGPTRTCDLLRGGRGLLLELDGEATLAGHARGRVDHVSATVTEDWRDAVDARAVLVRPDGHVCWAAGAESPEAALLQWFGR